MSNAVDFSNPDALAAELDAMEAEKATEETKTKTKKASKPRIVVCPSCGHEFELPKAKRGTLAGIPVEEMTEDQLKIEYRNASSVLYKTQKAAKEGKNVREGSLEAAQARVNKVKAIMDEKGIAPTARATKVDAADVAKMIANGVISVDDIQKMLDQLQEQGQ